LAERAHGISPPRRIVRWLQGIVGFGGALALGGCSILPDPQVDPTRFFVLSTTAAVVAPAVGNAPALQLRAVELAGYLRSRPLIVRSGENEIQFREFSRWGEPLEQGIARVLREELLARGAAASVAVPGVRAGNRPADYDLTLRVLACEGAANGAVIFRAIWELAAATGDAARVAQGDFRAGDLRWDGKNEGSLAAQLSQAIAGLAAEIAAAVPKGK
jgi:uncharacterized lipoprotein YmbA